MNKRRRERKAKKTLARLQKAAAIKKKRMNQLHLKILFIFFMMQRIFIEDETRVPRIQALAFAA